MFFALKYLCPYSRFTVKPFLSSSIPRDNYSWVDQGRELSGDPIDLPLFEQILYVDHVNLFPGADNSLHLYSKRLRPEENHFIINN